MKLASIVALVGVAGCNSHYLPQQRGKVAVLIHDGQVTYARDGQLYPHGLFGRGLENAVVGNPAAMIAAGEFRSRITTGFIAVLAGGIGTVVGASWASAEAIDTNSAHNVALPLAVCIGSLVVMLVGTSYAASAEPYRWDAINLFNDGGAQPPVQLPPGYGPTAKLSLKMRGD